VYGHVYHNQGYFSHVYGHVYHEQGDFYHVYGYVYHDQGEFYHVYGYVYHDQRDFYHGHIDILEPLIQSNEYFPDPGYTYYDFETRQKKPLISVFISYASC
jgi:hypothetical protein